MTGLHFADGAVLNLENKAFQLIKIGFFGTGIMRGEPPRLGAKLEDSGTEIGLQSIQQAPDTIEFRSTAGGTRVVLPAPGGATSTSARDCRSRSTISGSALSIGNGQLTTDNPPFHLIGE